MGDISGQVCSADDSGHEKTFMRRSVMVDFRSQHRPKKKKITKNNTKQTLTYIICLGNPGYTSPRLCVHSVFLMWPVVAYSLHKSFISLAFLDVDCRVEVVTLLSQCM